MYVLICELSYVRIKTQSNSKLSFLYPRLVECAENDHPF